MYNSSSLRMIAHLREAFIGWCLRALVSSTSWYLHCNSGFSYTTSHNNLLGHFSFHTIILKVSLAIYYLSSVVQRTLRRKIISYLFTLVYSTVPTNQYQAVSTTNLEWNLSTKIIFVEAYMCICFLEEDRRTTITITITTTNVKLSALLNQSSIYWSLGLWPKFSLFQCRAGGLCLTVMGTLTTFLSLYILA